MTGFTLFEYSTSAKWLELLKEIAPGVKRAGVVREAGTATGTGHASPQFKPRRQRWVSS